MDAGSSYTQEQALQDFAVGFIGDLAGGGLGDLINKYGADAVAKGLKKIGFDDARIESLTGISSGSGNGSRNAVGTIVTSGTQHGTATHWRTMQSLARQFAGNGDTVYLNKSINTALGKQIPGVGNWRPDVLSIGSDRTINITEVISPSQTNQQMIDKVNTMARALRDQGYRVNTNVFGEAGDRIQ